MFIIIRIDDTPQFLSYENPDSYLRPSVLLKPQVKSSGPFYAATEPVTSSSLVALTNLIPKPPVPQVRFLTQPH